MWTDSLHPEKNKSFTLNSQDMIVGHISIRNPFLSLTVAMGDHKLEPEEPKSSLPRPNVWHYCLHFLALMIILMSETQIYTVVFCSILYSTEPISHIIQHSFTFVSSRFILQGTWAPPTANYSYCLLTANILFHIFYDTNCQVGTSYF